MKDEVGTLMVNKGEKGSLLYRGGKQYMCFVVLEMLPEIAKSKNIPDCLVFSCWTHGTKEISYTGFKAVR